ncbi:MAG TPA: hypothetical protein VFR35_12805 [Actinoplanes sp.]|nr:hypothetical protein [Actinoplanes sp.]
MLARGAEQPPAFSVLADPTAAAPGGRIAVLHRSLVDGVSITGCSAGFKPDAMADCRQTAQGWIADVDLPTKTAAGSGALRWTVAYSRAGQNTPGSTDGLLNFTVLAAVPVAEEPGIWTTLWGLLWRVVLGGALLAGLVGARRIGTRGRTWWKEHRAGNPGVPESVRVVPVIPDGPLDVDLSNPDAPPRRLIRLTYHRRPPDISIREEKP